MRIRAWIGLVGITICAAGMMVFLPDYASDRVDAGMLNIVSTYEQQQTDTMNQGLSVIDKMGILAQGLAEGNQTSVISRNDIDNLDDIDDQLLSKLKQQLTQLEEKKLIPDVQEMKQTEWKYDRVVLNAYTCSQYPGKVLYVWDITVTIPGYASLYVTLDASTYAVYSYIYQDEPDGEKGIPAFDTFLACRGEQDGMEQYMNEWMQDYMNYLGEEATVGTTWKMYVYSETGEDNIGDGADAEQENGVITSNTGDPYFAIYLRVDYTNRYFQFALDVNTAGYNGDTYKEESTEESIAIEIVP